jgi:type IV pilus assembly protein PilN
MQASVINLASQPFRRERAQNVLLVLLCSVLTCSLLILTVLILRERAQAADLRRGIERERASLRLLQREQAEFMGILGKPSNADVFAVSVFLNELIARRTVSWTHVFSDLETVMPYNMRLVSLRLPQVPAEDAAGKNHVQLDMQVGSDRPDAVLELLKRLQDSSLFGAAELVNQQPPTQNDPLFRYRITVAYAQKL